MKCLVLLAAILALCAADGFVKDKKEATKDVLVAAVPQHTARYYTPNYQYSPYYRSYSAARTPYEYDLGPYRTYIPGGVYSHAYDHEYPYQHTNAALHAHKYGSLYDAGTAYAYKPYVKPYGGYYY